jgi:hypothetical protein
LFRVSLFQNEENGFLKDRRLHADGFIIRAQAMIRTDGFFVRAGFANTCALRAPTSFFKVTECFARAFPAHVMHLKQVFERIASKELESMRRALDLPGVELKRSSAASARRR